MPLRDGSGPEGRGSRTGLGLGPCPPGRTLAGAVRKRRARRIPKNLGRGRAFTKLRAKLVAKKGARPPRRLAARITRYGRARRR